MLLEPSRPTCPMRYIGVPHISSNYSGGDMDTHDTSPLSDTPVLHGSTFQGGPRYLQKATATEHFPRPVSSASLLLLDQSISVFLSFPYTGLSPSVP